ncbi:hypothetical protein CQA53_00620 [Helicobacter didelphidarum]|uniref:Uncharacterized protein n=1 Tax=Helicobacter didelphidarum TaxID=2040648 RepID=A0A3D8ISF7_9HELI|nr:hypothetical protein [Helicobacter didelphidarum]RDU67554.1 hypothetical protein CQA53_00620 [Helicobacter didelphidarum]
MKDTRQIDSIEAMLHNYKLLYSLYSRHILGDCYVSLSDVATTEIRDTMQVHNIQNDFLQNNIINSRGYNIDILNAKIQSCKLCDVSKMVRDNERFCGFYPMDCEYIQSENRRTDNFPKIAFIVESLHITSIKQKDNNAHLSQLTINKSNEMLLNIIEKVFGYKRTSVFIFPRFKCVEVGQNQAISTNIRMRSLENERRICKEYLLHQLEYVDYAVFFGEYLCQDFFQAMLNEVNGKLLDYTTQNHKNILCICVADILQMIANPTLKKDSMINFVLLKNAIKANLSR